jgi:hypothetical protein
MHALLSSPEWPQLLLPSNVPHCEHNIFILDLGGTANACGKWQRSSGVAAAAAEMQRQQRCKGSRDAKAAEMQRHTQQQNG